MNITRYTLLHEDNFDVLTQLFLFLSLFCSICDIHLRIKKVLRKRKSGRYGFANQFPGIDIVLDAFIFLSVRKYYMYKSSTKN